MPTCGISERSSAVSGENDLGALVRRRIAEISELAPGAVGDQMCFQLLRYDPEGGDFVMSCHTEPWMRNSAGTLHGGLCAAILDQAMGFVSHCLTPDGATAPTVQLGVEFHRPLLPGENVIVKVHIVSATRNLMSLTAEAAQESNPEKICLSGSGIFFNKPKKA